MWYTTLYKITNPPVFIISLILAVRVVLVSDGFVPYGSVYA